MQITCMAQSCIMANNNYVDLCNYYYQPRMWDCICNPGAMPTFIVPVQLLLEMCSS